EVRASHPRFEGSERVLHSLPAHAHGIWHLIEPVLHCVEDTFVLPALDPLYLVRRTLGLERTGEASGQMAVLVDVAAAVRSDKPSHQVLAGRAGVMVFLGVVDEVLPREEAALGAARCQCLWHTGQHAGILACQYLIAIEIAPITQNSGRVVPRCFLR